MQENIHTTEKEQIFTTLELKDYIRLGKKHKWVIIPCMLLVLAISLYISISTIPEYKASTLIMIEEENRAQQFIGFESGFEQISLKNEIEILKSRSLAETVIDSLLKSSEKNNLYALNTRIYKPKTIAISTWMKKIFSLGMYKESPVLPADLGTVKNGIIQKFSTKLRRNISIDSRRDTRTIEISFSSPNKEEAAFVANVIVEVYRKIDRDWKNSEIVELAQFLQQQLNKVSRDLSIAENHIKEFQEKENIMNLSDEHPILNQLTNYETTYFSTLAEVNVIENQINHIQSLLNNSEKSLVKDLQNTMDPRIKELRLHLAEQEAILVNTLKDVNMDYKHRAILEIQDQIDYMKAQLKDETSKLVANGITVQDPLSHSQNMVLKIIELNSEQIQLESKTNEYSKLIAQLNEEIKKLPSITLTYARLTRERKVKEQLYLLLSEKLEETRITEASQTAHIRVIDEAVSGIKVKPDISRDILLGIILGLGLGVGIAFLIEYLDQSLRSIESIQRLGISVIGIIPQIGTKYGRYRKKGFFKNKQVSPKNQANVNNFTERIITHLDPLNPVSEAYRSIRTNISYSLPDKEIKSIMISSPGPSEGKTTTAINLAIAFSQLGKKTLLVDTDLRKPIIHKIFTFDRQPGIADFLVGINGNDDLSGIINKTDIKNLHIITSGKLFPNPSELLGSKRMIEVIKRLELDFDIVIYDSPPIIAVTDSRMIVNDVDAMVLIVKSGQTDAHHLRRAINMLGSVNAPLIGCILNGFTHRHSYYGDYDYYYEYYYAEHLKD